MPVNFYELIGPGGKDEARHVFERLVVQMVRLNHPAMGIAAKPGDWGIDALVGELDDIVSVWQAKFFIDGFGPGQEQQVRESFKSAMKAAGDHGYTVDAWTLCVPVEPEAETAKWWANWRRRNVKATGVQIEMMPGSAIETLLMSPEAEHLARHYFPKSMGGAFVPIPVKVLPLPSAANYDEALFVKQLGEAGIPETTSAKRQFFNYEVLSREVADKADPHEVQTLETDQAEIHALWETRFSSIDPNPATGRCPGLHGDVMRAIEAHHQGSFPTRPPMSVVHRLGGMHRIVENGEAGWVAHFRRVAEAHRG